MKRVSTKDEGDMDEQETKHEGKRRHSVGDRGIIKEFLSSHPCYDLLPISSQIIVFDISLPLKKAFYAMLQNEIRAATLWNSEQQCVVGMLTVTDFINILRHYHYNPPVNETDMQLEDHLIQSWKEQETKKPMSNKDLFSLNPMGTIYDAAKMLIANQIHRVPLIDRGDNKETVIGVIKQFKILRFLATNLKEIPSFFHKSVQELGIGTFQGISTATMENRLIDVLDLMKKYRISVVPIVDQHGVLLDVYEKFDVTYLARVGALRDLNMTIEKALQHRIKEVFEGVHTCLETDTLLSIMETIKMMTLHRLLVVDKEGRLKGILSLSDILSFLIR